MLLLSASIKPAWERKKKDTKYQQQQQQDGYFTANHQQIAFSGTTLTTNEGAPTPPNLSSSMPRSNATPSIANNKMYIITPRTRILTVSKEHCIVFVIDLSSSLATIETSTGKVMIGSAFTVLENIIQGLVKPFSIYTSETSPPIVVK